MSFIEGFLIGLGTVIFFGPVFFTILNATLQYGQRGGLMATFGIVTSDLVWALVCSLATPFVNHPNTQFWLTIIGCLVLFGMGLKYLFIPIKFQETALKLDPKHYFGFFSKGFIVNISSPITCAYWLAVELRGAQEYPGIVSEIIFVGSVLLGIFLIDVLKVFLSRQFRRLLQSKTLKIISAVTGVILIGFGIRLVFELF
jgi:threonine/homoserine/homoserine lactone efflux protein